MKKLHLKVLFDVATDLGELWASLKDIDGIHLGGEGQSYTVYFNGKEADGIKALNICLEKTNVGKFYADYEPYN